MPERQVLIESFDDASEWNAIGDAALIENETSEKTQGIGAVKFSKQGVTVDYGGIYKTYNGLDLGQYVNYKLDVFIPEGFKDLVYGFDIILDNSASIGDAFPGWTRSYEGNQEPNVWSTPGPAWVLFGTDRATVIPTNILELTNPVNFEDNRYLYTAAELFTIGWFAGDGSRYRRYKTRVQVDSGAPNSTGRLHMRYQGKRVLADIDDDQVDINGNIKVVDTTQDFVVVDTILGDLANNFQSIINGEFFVAGTPTTQSGNQIEFGKPSGGLTGTFDQRWDWLRLGSYGANANFAAISTPVSGLVEGQWNTLTIQPKAPSYSLGIGGQPGSVTRLALVFWTKQTTGTFSNVIIDNLRAIPSRSYSIQPAVLMDWKLRTQDLESFDVGDVLVDGFEDASEWAAGPGTTTSNEISWFVEGDQSVGINRKPPTLPKLKKFVMGVGI